MSNTQNISLSIFHLSGFLLISYLLVDHGFCHPGHSDKHFAQPFKSSALERHDNFKIRFRRNPPNDVKMHSLRQSHIQSVAEVPNPQEIVPALVEIKKVKKSSSFEDGDGLNPKQSRLSSKISSGLADRAKLATGHADASKTSGMSEKYPETSRIVARDVPQDGVEESGGLKGGLKVEGETENEISNKRKGREMEKNIADEILRLQQLTDYSFEAGSENLEDLVSESEGREEYIERKKKEIEASEDAKVKELVKQRERASLEEQRAAARLKNEMERVKNKQRAIEVKHENLVKSNENVKKQVQVLKRDLRDSKRRINDRPSEYQAQFYERLNDFQNRENNAYDYSNRKLASEIIGVDTEHMRSQNGKNKVIISDEVDNVQMNAGASLAKERSDRDTLDQGFLLGLQEKSMNSPKRRYERSGKKQSKAMLDEYYAQKLAPGNYEESAPRITPYQTDHLGEEQDGDPVYDKVKVKHRSFFRNNRKEVVDIIYAKKKDKKLDEALTLKHTLSEKMGYDRRKRRAFDWSFSGTERQINRDLNKHEITADVAMSYRNPSVGAERENLLNNKDMNHKDGISNNQIKYPRKSRLDEVRDGKSLSAEGGGGRDLWNLQRHEGTGVGEGQLINQGIGEGDRLMVNGLNVGYQSRDKGPNEGDISRSEGLNLGYQSRDKGLNGRDGTRSEGLNVGYLSRSENQKVRDRSRVEGLNVGERSRNEYLAGRDKSRDEGQVVRDKSSIGDILPWKSGTSFDVTENSEPTSGRNMKMLIHNNNVQDESISSKPAKKLTNHDVDTILGRDGALEKTHQRMDEQEIVSNTEKKVLKEQENRPQSTFTVNEKTDLKQDHTGAISGFSEDSFGRKNVSGNENETESMTISEGKDDADVMRQAVASSELDVTSAESQTDRGEDDTSRSLSGTDSIVPNDGITEWREERMHAMNNDHNFEFSVLSNKK